MTTKYRSFIKAMYLVGVLLLVNAVSEPLVQTWPLHPGTVQWRFGAVGLLTTAMAGIVFAWIWIMGVAALLDHRRTLRVLSVVSLIGALALCGLLVGFGLDFLQMRANVNPQMRGALDATVLRALVTVALSIVAAVAVGLSGWRSTRIETKRAAKTAREGELVYSRT